MYAGSQAETSLHVNARTGMACVRNRRGACCADTVFNNALLVLLKKLRGGQRAGGGTESHLSAKVIDSFYSFIQLFIYLLIYVFADETGLVS